MRRVRFGLLCRSLYRDQYASQIVPSLPVRINGVELPEGLSVFGQALETRFAHSIFLLTGALPAQYGFFTAGVLDIQTKTGLTNPGLAFTM
jgi:hypothetical protein